MPDLSDLAAALRRHPFDDGLRAAFTDELISLTGCSKPAAAHVAHSIYGPVINRRHVLEACEMMNRDTKKAQRWRSDVALYAGIQRNESCQLIICYGEHGPRRDGNPRNAEVWEQDVNSTMPHNVGGGPMLTAEPEGAYVLIGSRWAMAYMLGTVKARTFVPPPPHQNHDSE